MKYSDLDLSEYNKKLIVGSTQLIQYSTKKDKAIVITFFERIDLDEMNDMKIARTMELASSHKVRRFINNDRGRFFVDNNYIVPINNKEVSLTHFGEIKYYDIDGKIIEHNFGYDQNFEGESILERDAVNFFQGGFPVRASSGMTFTMGGGIFNASLNFGDSNIMR